MNDTYGFIIYSKSVDFDSGFRLFIFHLIKADQEVFEQALNGTILCYGDIRYYSEGDLIRLSVTKMDPSDLNTECLCQLSDDKDIFSVSNATVIDFKDKYLKELLIRQVLPNIADSKLRKLIDTDLYNKNSIRMTLSQDDTDALYKKITLYKYKELLYNRLLENGFNFDEIIKILNSDKRITKKNVYDIINITSNIKSIDSLAIKEFNYEEYNIKRLYAFLIASINDFISLGHSCIPMDRIIPLIERQFDLNGYYKTKVTKDIIDVLISYSNGYLSIQSINSIDYIYITKIYELENSIKENIHRLLSNNRFKNVSFSYAEDKNNITYNKNQRQAFKLLNKSGIKILTGPPGSGKTALIKGLITVFNKSNPNKQIKLAATTGRAAKVLTSMSSDKDFGITDAVTVHKLLHLTPFNEELLSKDINNPIDADFIIVDEVSMMGTFLLYKLLNAVKTGSILLLVGDEDQLESVDYGNVLHDLIDSGVIETYRLTEILRQSGTICNNAEKIKHNDYHLIFDDTFLDVMGNDDYIVNELKHNIKNNSKYQILSPIKNGYLGTFNLNDICGNNTNDILFNYRKKVFRKNDKVIMIRTNYELGYVNGDIGYLEDFVNGEIIIKIEDSTIKVPIDYICDIEHAGAITIHKAQGSEFDEIHVVLPESASSMISRKLIYTAITRAKKKVYFYHQSNMDDLLNNTIDRIRISNLSQFIKM